MSWIACPNFEALYRLRGSFVCKIAQRLKKEIAQKKEESQLSNCLSIIVKELLLRNQYMKRDKKTSR